MNKEQQDKAWAYLPKEARDEIKRLFSNADATDNFTAIGVFLKIFGHHNLTSDTEPKEMLMVERSKVITSYNVSHKGISSGYKIGDVSLVEYSKGRNDQLKFLFGDKCLPDKAEEIADKCIEPVKEHFEKEKSKFKVGDKVRVNDARYNKVIGTFGIVKQVEKLEYEVGHVCTLENGAVFRDCYLEPYTEPSELLYVERKKVSDLLQWANECTDDTEEAYIVKNTIECLFGDKCLPDKEDERLAKKIDCADDLHEMFKDEFPDKETCKENLQVEQPSVQVEPKQ